MSRVEDTGLVIKSGETQMARRSNGYETMVKEMNGSAAVRLTFYRGEGMLGQRWENAMGAWEKQHKSGGAYLGHHGRTRILDQMLDFYFADLETAGRFIVEVAEPLGLEQNGPPKRR